MAKQEYREIEMMNDYGLAEDTSRYLTPLDFSQYIPNLTPFPEEGSHEPMPIFPTVDKSGSAKANDNILHAIRGETFRYHY